MPKKCWTCKVKDAVEGSNFCEDDFPVLRPTTRYEDRNVPGEMEQTPGGSGGRAGGDTACDIRKDRGRDDRFGGGFGGGQF